MKLAIFVFLCALCAVCDVDAGTRQARCNQPFAQTGYCLGYIPRFAYNSATNKCERFVYGGCNGNDNQWETKWDCETDCDVNHYH